MNAPSRTWRPFLFSSIGFSLALVATASVYSHAHPADHWLLTAALPAFLLEGFLYLAATLERPRMQFASLGTPPLQAALLWISAVLPYLVFSVLASTFQGRACLLLMGLTALLCFWPVVMPRRWAFDAGFLVLAAVPIVVRVFRRIYVSPDPEVAVDILGHVMWLRVGIAAILVLRQWNPGTFGLWPEWREWKAGLLYFGVSILPICMLAVAVQDVRFAPLHRPLWQMAGIGAGTFFGILWVVALGEELLFRGVIARMLNDAWHSQAAAVIVSALLYGSGHLWFHQFPNWRRALVAVLIGLFCGTLYFRSGGVRAPMVTHSLIVVTWRLLFS